MTVPEEGWCWGTRRPPHWTEVITYMGAELCRSCVAAAERTGTTEGTTT